MNESAAERSAPTTHLTHTALDVDAVSALWAALPSSAATTVDAVVGEVREFATALSDPDRVTLRRAVHQALATFLRRATQPDDPDPGVPAAGLDAAYALGRGEAKAGRTMDSLLSAYRVGARSAWREFAFVLNNHSVPARAMGDFAEQVFVYIDELSAASVAGHTDELAVSGRVREQQRERLSRALLAGEGTEQLIARAERADWAPPETLTAVLIPAAHVRQAIAALDPRTLIVAGDVANTAEPATTSVLLVPDAHHDRSRLLAALANHAAVVGPTRSWTEASASFHRAQRAADLPGAKRVGGTLDTDAHLVEIILDADPEALAELRVLALAPLASFRHSARARLTETLQAWLLHQGRRDDVARALNIHPQTVRYRMTQLRDAYGERLTEPTEVLRLIIALATLPPDTPAGVPA